MKNILFTILTICLVWACYDDKSTLPTVEYPTISVNRSGESQYLTVSYGEEFIYEPRLYWLDGKDTIYLSEDTYDDYDYEWDLSVLSTGTDTMKQIISRERILKAVINSTPTTSGYSYYTLTLHVTHRASGVVKNLIWEMKVLSVYGGGLLVAETSDETNSDISLIMSRTFNTNLVDYDTATCAGQSWLYGQGFEWTITTYSSNSSSVLRLSSDFLGFSDARSGYLVRPVLYLDSSVYVMDGNGSVSDPYIIGM